MVALTHRSGCQSSLFVAVVAMCAAFGLANLALADGGWIEFDDETAQRLIVPENACSGGSNNGLACNNSSDCPGGVCHNLGAGDPEEKDYAWGDVDHDGDIDMVIVRKRLNGENGGPQGEGIPGPRVNLLLMNEGGMLVNRTDEYATASTDGSNGFQDPTDDRDVILHDLNGDGWLDMVTAPVCNGCAANTPKTITHPRVYINLKNDQNRNWQGFEYREDYFPEFPIKPNMCGIGVGDVTGDGSPDLYFAEYLNNLEDRLMINDGTGRFTDETSPRMQSFFTNSVFGTHAAIADLNGDGFNDIIKDDGLAYFLRITYNDPNDEGHFDHLDRFLPGGSPYFFSVGNLNNDSRPDLVIADDSLDLYRFNTGNDAQGAAQFTGGTFPGSGSFGGNTLIADLDDDGWNDVLIADMDPEFDDCEPRLLIYRNKIDEGGAPFENSGVHPWTPFGVHDIGVFDIDGDTKLDIVIGTCTNTRVWMNNTVSVFFSYPEGLPTQSSPDGGTMFPVDITANNGNIVGGTETLHVAFDDGSFDEYPLVEGDPGQYIATLPGGDCPALLNYYISAQADNGSTYIDPPSAPEMSYQAIAAEVIDQIYEARFEDDAPDWTVQSDNLTAGEWERVDPVGTQTGGLQAQPENDAGEGSDAFCFITEQHTGGGVGASDVDGGPTRLISPMIDLSDGDAVISYERWHFSAPVGDGDIDEMTTQVSNNGSLWVDVDATSGTDSQWRHHAFRVGAYVAPNATVQVRFSVTDNPNNSYTESGIDNFTVDQLSCVDDAGPEIVHGLGNTSFADQSFGGYIDPRRESDNGVDVNQGIDQIVIGFNEPAVDAGGTELTSAAFTIVETGGATPPSIIGYQLLDDQTIRLDLDRHITVQEWTTVIANVEDLLGNPIPNLGNQGPGINEPDRVDIGYLPADTDQNSQVSPFDLLNFRQVVNNQSTPSDGLPVDYVDTDRSGTVSPFDLLSFRQLVNGVAPATQSWNGASMNNPRP